MNRVGQLGLAQRIVLVVALAGALRIVARWLLIERGPSGGWFGYPPDNLTLTMSDPQRFQ